MNATLPSTRPVTIPSLSRFAGGDLYHPQQKRYKTDRSIRNDDMKLS